MSRTRTSAIYLTIPSAILAATTYSLARTASSDEAILRASWRGYVSTFVDADGRVRRPEHGNDTVSEGQAYTMMRAVWMNDRALFDRVRQWTADHLRGGDSVLLAWHWEANGDRGRVTDSNFASDADADYALALILAARRWQPAAEDRLPDGYLHEARRMLAALLDRSTASDDDDVLMWLPGSWADERATGGGLVLNPSYLAPAWFRVFHEVTGDPRWLRLADSSYVVLQAVCGEGPRALPVVPDWIRWHSAAKWALRGSAEPTSSWDAVRVPWRIGTDRLWFGAPAARSFLDGCMRPYLARREHQGLAVEMSADGRVLGSQDHALANAMYSFAASTDPVRDRLIERVARQAVWTGPDTLRFGDGRHYYVESLAYLPFLARTNAYNPR